MGLLSINDTNLCRPESTNSSSFRKMLSFLQDIEKKAVVSIHECHELPEYPIELEIRTQDIQKKLRDVAILGICGMGGIGKTTLAKKVFNIMSKDFEYTCFLDNVKGKDVGTLKDTILGQFQHKGMRPQQALTEWSQLKGEKTLLVMDDVDAEEQLRMLPLGQFKDGSRLIMTSRDREVFKFYGSCIVYQVEFLQNDAAAKLFCEHAFGRDPIPYNLREHVKKIVTKCGGLPLTLEVMGRYLRGRTEKVGVWKEILNKLENATPIHGNDRVWPLLKVSYDGLQKAEQELFVEAALVFFEQPLEIVLAAWGNAETIWENLLSKSLVKEITKTRHPHNAKDEEEYKEVWIHEHFRDLARSIAGNDMVWHGRDEGANLILLKLNTNEMKTMTKSVKLVGSTPLGLDSLQKLEQLKYLTLEAVDIEGRGKDPESPIRMDNLVFLELRNCVIPDELVEALGNLTNLRILTLWGSRELKRLPENFGNLSQLRRLGLHFLDPLVLPESFGNLRSLEYLTISRGEGLVLPESFGDLSSLSILNIVNCYGLESLPDSFGQNLTSLKNLFICQCGIECLPRNFSKLAGLENLRIKRCYGVKELGDSFGELFSLQTLTLCEVGVRMLPASFGHLTALKELHIERCSELETLPENFGSLKSLEVLRLVWLHKVERLPKNLELMISLREVHLELCDKLTSVPDSLGKPSSSQSRLQSGRESDDLRGRGGESSQTTSTGGVRLYVLDCPYLYVSVLGSLSWGYVESDRIGGCYYKRHA